MKLYVTIAMYFVVLMFSCFLSFCLSLSLPVCISFFYRQLAGVVGVEDQRRRKEENEIDAVERRETGERRTKRMKKKRE